jgi:AsmA protein
VTAATGFKRLGFLLAAAIIAGICLLTLMSWLVSTETVRMQVKEDIKAVTGLEPVMRGSISVRLFPSGSVSFDDVVLGDGSDRALTAERLTARLRLIPLLLGQVEIADIALEQPTITIDIAPGGRSNWSGLTETLAQANRPNARAGAAFSEIKINDGRIILRDREHDINETLDRVEMSLAWPSISNSFGATGHFMWRHELVDGSMTLSDFAAALSGAKTGLKLRIAGRPLKAAFDGSISMKPSLKIEGTLAADSPSLRQAMLWAGQKPLPGGGFGRFALKAQTNVVGGTIALTGVNVELDGNAAEGVLTFATDGRQTLQGTLAADTLDLTPYTSTVRLVTANHHEWSDGRLSLDGLTSFDVDLRLSAAKVVMANAKLGRTAIGANLRGGHLSVTVGESQAFGGVIKGSFAMANLETGIDLKSQLQFSGVDLEACLGQLFGMHRIEGKGNFAFALEGSGDSILALTQTLTGSASLTGRDGALVGMNVEQVLRRLERRPLSAGNEFRSGRTPYDKLSATIKIARGKITIDDVKMQGAAVRIGLAGSASVPARELDLKGTAELVSAAKAATNTAAADTTQVGTTDMAKTDATFSLPFIVQGSWDDPIVLPDPDILIRRSDATAPLLNAVRDRGLREAVRPALERLLGVGKPAATTADAPAQPQQ